MVDKISYKNTIERLSLKSTEISGEMTPYVLSGII